MMLGTLTALTKINGGKYIFN